MTTLLVPNKNQFLIFIFCLMCMCVGVWHICECPRKAQQHVFLELQLRVVLSYPIWVLGTELGSYGRAINAHTFKKQKNKKNGGFGKRIIYLSNPKIPLIFNLSIVFFFFFFCRVGWGCGYRTQTQSFIDAKEVPNHLAVPLLLSECLKKHLGLCDKYTGIKNNIKMTR